MKRGVHLSKKLHQIDIKHINKLLSTPGLEIAALYRVSSPSQVKGDEEVPIPAQQRAARELCKVKNWNLSDDKEFVEPGVSAFRNSVMDRDVIHDVIREAKKGTFKILLVFKHNRLSRLEAEYPWILRELLKHGVIVWEIARDKRLTPITHEEALTTYIDGWMAEGESRSISVNVRNGILTKVTSGHRVGGCRGYGFEIKDRYIDDSGKKPKMRSVFGINIEEANIIKMIVKMYEDGHGSKYIAKTLNSNGYRIRNGSEWNSQYIRRILRNPGIAGIYLYRIDGKDPRRVHSYKDLYDPAYYIHKDKEGNYITEPELTIIPPERWFNLMNIMDSRITGKHRQSTQIQLLSGFTKCGYCNRSMSAVTASGKYRKKDGTYSIYDKSGYRCNSHTIGLTCQGPHQININKVNNSFYSHLELFFSNFDPEALICSTEDETHRINDIKNQIKKQESELTKTEHIKKKWLNELDEYFARSGDYILSKKNIAAKISEQEEKINKLTTSLSKLKKSLDAEINKRQNIRNLSKIIPRWYGEFKDKPIEVQNKMLQHILDEVIIYRDKIDIVYSINVAQMAKYKSSDNQFVNICKTVELA